MNEFQRAAEFDPTAVTLEIVEADGETFGSVMLPADGGHGRLRVQTTDDPGLSAKEALAFAIQKANELGVPIVVIDRHDAWQEEW